MKTAITVSASQAEPNRREFLELGVKTAAVSALAGVALPHVHAAPDSTTRMAIVGCGGRGTGAISDALSVAQSPVKLVAMADLFEDKMSRSHQSLTQKFTDRIEVPKEQRFLGLGAFKQAMDCLRPGDIVVLSTHAAFRATHLEYAIQRGLNVFMEKSFAPDPGGIQRILRLGEEADKKGLKVACGLMCRHSSARQALIQKIREGELGQIVFTRAFRMDSGSRMGPRKEQDNEVHFQLRNPYSFFWVSTGRFIDYIIHQVDECCWIKDAWPVSAHGLGGRSPDNNDCGQALDTYGVEYQFADGSRAQVNLRGIPKCHSDFSTFTYGAKKAAQFSGNVHLPTVQIYKDQRTENNNIEWRPEKEIMSPYQAEWKALLEAIRDNRPHNEVKRSAYSNLAAIMGRAAVHTGQIITWDQAMASNFQFCPNIDSLTADGPAPVQADATGHYPVPVPGQWKEI